MNPLSAISPNWSFGTAKTSAYLEGSLAISVLALAEPEALAITFTVRSGYLADIPLVIDS